MSKVVVLVATHKRYRMPDSPMYLPVQVGAEGKVDLGYVKDNTDDNISTKNPNFCELTGLYWMWKNVQADYVGLVHYRRHFAAKNSKDKWMRIADEHDIMALLTEANAILPRKRNYYIETTYEQYAHAHHAVDLDMTRSILAENYPEYVETFDSCMRRTDGHKFNMFIMKRDIADAYCEWLFSVLFELEKRLDISSYSQNDSRVFGFVAERLLDVWVETNHITYKEMPVVFMEEQNWFVKGGDFLKRKFTNRLI
ncbi:MAG: DUF4422 domain-containing protein [Firmicutes bacterium]|nr:DUF4422 domain-containing protein [Bacillota bacterium]MCD8315558.1 DUF4422 domain-containing protein [Bacillota bacterium]